MLNCIKRLTAKVRCASKGFIKRNTLARGIKLDVSWLKTITAFPVLLLSSYAVAGTLTNVSMTVSDTLPGAKATYTFKYTTETELRVVDSHAVIYVSFPNGFYIVDDPNVMELNICQKLSVKVNNVAKTCANSNAWGGNRWITITEDVAAGSAVEVTLTGVTNSTTESIHSFNFIRTSNTGGHTVDDWHSLPTITIAEPNNAPTWQHWREFPLDNVNGYRTASGDFNNDGNTDVIVSGTTSGTSISLNLNDGSGNFTTLAVDIPAGAAIREFGVADFDSDGDLDFVAADFALDTAYYFENNGATPTPSFSRVTLDESAGNIDGASHIDVANIDGVNGLDFVITRQNNGDEIFLYLNDGTGNFTQSKVYDPGANWGLLEVHAVDVNGDNHLDLVTGDYTSSPSNPDANFWIAGNGDGTFSTTYNQYSGTVTAITYIKSADLDFDGDKDLIAGGNGHLHWFENDGTGSFTTHQLSTQVMPSAQGTIANIADYDGDGDIDIIVSSNSVLFWYENIGSGNFVDHEILTNFGTIRDHQIIDFDGDGKLDIAVSDHAAKKTIWLKTQVNFSIVENNTSVGNLEAVDADDDILTYSVVGGADATKFSVNANNGSLRFISAPDYENPNDSDTDGVYNVTVSVSDGVESITMPVVVTLLDENDAPIISQGASTSVSMSEDGAPTVFSLTLAAIDDDNDTLTWSIASDALNGIAEASGTGNSKSINYTPSADYAGVDSFVVQVSDGNGGTDTITVNVTIESVNDLPVANLQSLNVLEDNSAAIVLSGTDIDGVIASYLVNSPSNGVLSGTAPNLVYTPNANFNGNDSFTFSVIDNDSGISSAATVNINVASVNDLPVAKAQSVNVQEDGSVAITLTGSDIDGTIASYNTSAVSNGTLSGTAPSLTYTPNAHFYGEDSFTFTVTDNESGVSSAATVNIFIKSVNDDPTTEDDYFEFDKNGNNQYTLNVTANDSDVDGDDLSLSSATSDIGNVGIVEDKLVFTAPEGFVGTVEITYSVTDGNQGFSNATVYLTIKGNFDELAPDITLPDDVEIDATALYTKVDLGIAKAVDANGNPLPVSLVDGNVMFAPGISKAYWQATDVEGNQSIAAQNVRVNPLISIGKDQTVIEGNTVTVQFYLNGTSPVYPVVVPFSVSGDAVEGDDHNLVAGEVSISKTNIASITFETFEDGIEDSGESIVIKLTGDGNLSAQSKQEIIITEDNMPAKVVLTGKQNHENRILFAQSSGEVTINALITDPNIQDSHSIAWTSASDVLDIIVADQTTETISFDAADLPVGIYKLTATVTDSGSPILTTKSDMYFSVVTELAALENIDSDGDLILDSLEGYSDQDGDGIADYLDAISACNVMPESADIQSSYLVEGEAGVCLRIGSTIHNTDSGSLLISNGEVAQTVGMDETVEFSNGIFDFIVYGLERAGQEYKLVLPQRQPIPVNAIYRKYTEANGWADFVIDQYNKVYSTQGEPGFCPPPGSDLWQEGLTEGHWCVQLQIVDGGPNDNDGVANGTIEDPSGVAILKNTNTAPVAVEDQASTLWNEAIDINVLDNDSDVDGDTLKVLSVTANFGTVTVLTDGIIQYQPALDYIGADIITYVISDSQGGIASAQVAITIIGNSLPIANDDSASTDDRTSITIDVLTNDSDADGDLLTVISASADNGSVSIIDNQLHYTPVTGFDGTDTVMYVIADGKGGEANAKVSIAVDAYEVITVTNESKSSGGASSLMLVLLLPLIIFKKLARMKTAFLILFSLMVTTLPAKADWRLEAGIGQTKVDVNKSSLNNKLSGLDANILKIDDSDSYWNLGVSYQFDSNWLANIGFTDLGSYKTTVEGMTLDPNDFHQVAANVQVPSASGFYAGIGYQYTLSEQWYVVGNVGVFSWENDNTSISTSENSFTQDGTDLYYSLALGYQLSTKISAGVTYSHYALPDNAISTLGVVLSYTF